MKRLQVYDPYVYAYVILNEVTTAKAVGDYVPVRSLKEGKWYAVYLPSNKSHNLKDIGSELRSLIEREVNTVEFTEALLEACAQVRNGICESVDADIVSVREQLQGTFGLSAYTRGCVRARYEGYTKAEIEKALAIIEREPSTESLEEKCVRISDLVEGE